MTLLEKLDEAKANLKAMTENSETKTEDLNEAIKSVEDIQAQIDAADKAEELMKSLAHEEVKEADTEEEKMEYNTLGEFAAANVKEANLDPRKRIDYVTPAFKTAAAMTIPSGVKPAITTYDANVYGNRSELMVEDLFSSEVISNNALTFFVESSTVEGGPAYTTEANEKPMMSFGDPTPVTAALRKIASYMKESEELVHDAPAHFGDTSHQEYHTEP